MPSLRGPLGGGGITPLGAGAGAGAFDPSVVAGLVAWWKADAITGLTDGSAVASWLDSGQNGYTATQSTGANKPTYKTAIQNALPIVRFNGTTWLAADGAASTFSGSRTPFTLVAVSAPAGSYSYRAFWSLGATDTAAYYEVGDGGGSTYWAEGKDGDSGGDGFGGATGTGFRVETLQLDASGQVTIWANGTQTLAATTIIGNLSVMFTLLTLGALRRGASGVTVGDYFKGDLGDVLVYSGVLSTSDRQAVETYLKSKYGL